MNALRRKARAAARPVPYNPIGDKLMRYSIAGLAICIGMACAGAAEKKLPIEQTSNELVDISATAVMDKDQIRQELGADPGADIVLVRVTVRPVSDKPILLSLDDFLLVSNKDGQRSEPFAPTQLAGGAALNITAQGPRATEVRGNRGITLGGLGGIGGGGGVGTSSQAPAGDSKVESVPAEKDSPLLAALKEKVLPEKEINDTVSGLLYFQITGKLKPKDLELHYKGPAGRLALRFRP